MNWLIIETSSIASSLTSISQGIVIAHKPLVGGEQLSRTLAQEVNQLLQTDPLKFDAIAVGTGPGSYTGIRVGAALAQSLAFGWKIPLYSFCSLASYGGEGPIAIDARGGGLYLLENNTLTKIPLTEVRAKVIRSPDAAALQQKLPTVNWIYAVPDPAIFLTFVRADCRILTQGVTFHY